MMEQALIEYVINALWQVPLLAGGAWLLLRMVRPAPLMQHRIWLAVLGLAVLLPLHGMSKTDVPDVVPAQRTAAVIEASHEEVLSPLALNELPPRRGQWFAFSALFSARTGSIRLTPRTAHWLLRLYVATIAIGLFRVARAWRAARGLVENSQETFLCHRDSTALKNLSDRLGIKAPQLRESREVSSPMIVGVAAPVLLLPEGFARHTEDEIQAALCHELAHIQRQDYLVNVACQVAALPLVWHPVVDWVQQRIRMTREMVCDAMAAQEMKSHLGYAKCLLALAHSMLGGREMPAQAQFLGLFSKSTLEERVMRLMDTTTMSVRVKAARAASGAVMMIATGVVAVAFHVTPTMAQANAQPPATQNPPADAPTQPSVAVPESTSPNNTVKQDDRMRATARKRTYVRRHGGDAECPELSQAEQQRIDKDVQQRMEDAQREFAEDMAKVHSNEFKQRMDDFQKQMAEVGPKLDSPEFKQRIDDAQREFAEGTAKLNSPEFKQRMGDLQRQMAEVRPKLDSPEFKQRIDDAQREFAEGTAKLSNHDFQQRMDDFQRQMAEVGPKLDSPEFKQRIEDAQRQMAEDMAKLGNHEFKHRMDDFQRQMADVGPKLNSPEVKQQMDDFQRQMSEVGPKLNSPEFKQRMDDLQKQMEKQMEEFSRRDMHSPNP
jgi:beta-lactamase regulating signal transducer with metallopeptidase domain